MTSATVVHRRRCACGRALVPLDNGTVPRHTAVVSIDVKRNVRRKRCVHVGELFPAIARERGVQAMLNVTGRPVRIRGGRRASKRDTKNLFRRNASGGYNGRPGSAGSSIQKKVGK
jgi:hypothetical protein